MKDEMYLGSVSNDLDRRLPEMNATLRLIADSLVVIAGALVAQLPGEERLAARQRETVRAAMDELLSEKEPL